MLDGVFPGEPILLAARTGLMDCVETRGKLPRNQARAGDRVRRVEARPSWASGHLIGRRDAAAVFRPVAAEQPERMSTRELDEPLHRHGGDQLADRLVILPRLGRNPKLLRYVLDTIGTKPLNADQTQSVTETGREIIRLAHERFSNNITSVGRASEHAVGALSHA